MTHAACPVRVIFDRVSQFCLAAHFRFAPKAAAAVHAGHQAGFVLAVIILVVLLAALLA
jgi:hypothetical protein